MVNLKNGWVVAGSATLLGFGLIAAGSLAASAAGIAPSILPGFVSSPTPETNSVGDDESVDGLDINDDLSLETPDPSATTIPVTDDDSANGGHESDDDGDENESESESHDSGDDGTSSGEHHSNKTTTSTTGHHDSESDDSDDSHSGGGHGGDDESDD
jgi:hypothetical protein